MTTPTDSRTATSRTPALDLHEGLTKLATYPFAILTFVDADGYPVSVAVSAAIDSAAGTAIFAAPAGLTVPAGVDISLTGSHIRPQPGYGYDERRHVTVWGRRDGRRGRRCRPRVLRRLPRLGLGRGGGPVLRVLRALDRPVEEVLRRAVRGARHAGQAEALVRLARPADDPPAVPVGHDRAGRAGHRDRRPPGHVRPADGRPHRDRRGVRPARAERRQRRVRHHPGRRRRERDADPVQWRLAGHPVRAGVAPPDGRAVDDLLRPRRGHRPGAAGAARLARAPRRSASSGSSSASATPRRR